MCCCCCLLLPFTLNTSRFPDSTPIQCLIPLHPYIYRSYSAHKRINEFKLFDTTFSALIRTLSLDFYIINGHDISYFKISYTITLLIFNYKTRKNICKITIIKCNLHLIGYATSYFKQPAIPYKPPLCSSLSYSTLYNHLYAKPMDIPST